MTPRDGRCRGARRSTPTSSRAVFALMGEKLDAGEVGKVIERLPPELRELWR